MRAADIDDIGISRPDRLRSGREIPQWVLPEQVAIGKLGPLDFAPDKIVHFHSTASVVSKDLIQRKFVKMRISKSIGLTVLLVSACQMSGTGSEEVSVQRFEVAADTVPCTGTMPMRCLVVNGEYFYDNIVGYDHVEGSSAVIYVEQTKIPGPPRLDSTGYTFRRVNRT